MAENKHFNLFFLLIYNFETVTSKYFLYTHRVQQVQMGAWKALTFMCHFYDLLLLFFPADISGLKTVSKIQTIRIS